MPHALTVTEPMDGYVLGERIYDAAEVEKLQHSRAVKRVWVADEDMPKADPEPIADAPAEPKGKAKPDASAK